jgi:hypothetical protein
MICDAARMSACNLGGTQSAYAIFVRELRQTVRRTIEPRQRDLLVAIEFDYMKKKASSYREELSRP